MRTKKHISNKKKAILVCVIVLVVLVQIFLLAKLAAKPRDVLLNSTDVKEIFASYEQLSWEVWEDGVFGIEYDGYDVREIEQQIDGFWEYYQEYERQEQELLQKMQEWKTDFIQEGTYVVGKDIDEGYYLFCNPSARWDSQDMYGKYSSVDKIGSYCYFSAPYYKVLDLKQGEVLEVRGNPKLAPLDTFLPFTVAEDDNYYGRYYRIGTDIPEGMYLAVSMNTQTGNISLEVPKEESDSISHTYGSGIYRTRFTYIDLSRKDREYICLDECVLIPLENKPTISPIIHEDVTYRNSDFIDGRDKKRKTARNKAIKKQINYTQPIYAQGEYIVGEDLPIGTYQIQGEIATAVSDRNSTQSHADHIVSYAKGSDLRYFWAGLYIPYQDMARQCGWESIRVGGWWNDRSIVGVTDVEGQFYGYHTEEGLPTVTFTQNDKGVIVRVIRALLIPM